MNRWPRLLTGLLLISAGTALTLRAGLGLGPWDVLNDGLSRRTSLSFGQGAALTSLITLALTWTAGQRPGIGTLANALLVGMITDTLLATGLGSCIPAAPLPPRIATLLCGLVIKGSGISLYLSAGLGAGPYDAAQLALSHRLGVPVALARASGDSLGLSAGLLLHGHAGLGTLLSVSLMPPILAVCFHLLHLNPATGTDAQDL